MPMQKVSTMVYQKENLQIKQILDIDNIVYWCVCDKQSDILYRHQDKDCAFVFAQQHNKMLQAQKQHKELENA